MGWDHHHLSPGWRRVRCWWVETTTIYLQGDEQSDVDGLRPPQFISRVKKGQYWWVDTTTIYLQGERRVSVDGLIPPQSISRVKKGQCWWVDNTTMYLQGEEGSVLMGWYSVDGLIPPPFVSRGKNSQVLMGWYHHHLFISRVKKGEMLMGWNHHHLSPGWGRVRCWWVDTTTIYLQGEEGSVLMGWYHHHLSPGWRTVRCWWVDTTTVYLQGEEGWDVDGLRPPQFISRGKKGQILMGWDHHHLYPVTTWALLLLSLLLYKDVNDVLVIFDQSLSFFLITWTSWDLSNRKQPKAQTNNRWSWDKWFWF